MGTDTVGLDKPEPLRDASALPLATLAPWLETHVGLDPTRLSAEVFTRGFSNQTYLVSDGSREVVLRRPPPGVSIRGAHDMLREARILQGVASVSSRVPRPLAMCDDPGVLDAPFYVMERVRGVIFRRELPPGLEPSDTDLRAASEGLADTLAEIHGVDRAAAGLAELGRPEGYVGRQVGGWTRRYGKAATESVPDMDRLAGWLAQHAPADAEPALVHNDYKYDNIVLDPTDLGCVLAVLDWEMATVGDPRLDVGTTLAYWVDPRDPPELHGIRLCPTHLAGNLDRMGVFERYLATSGRSAFEPLWFYAFGLFKIAVIVQQLYARYVRGLTTEDRYARMGDAVKGLAAVALRAIDRGRIVDLG